MAKRKGNPWMREDVVDYVLESYGGTEDIGGGRLRRVFLWADKKGEVWIGNSAAFAAHCADRFGFKLLKYDYVAVNSILVAVGERLRDKQPRTKRGGPPQAPLKPDARKAK